MLMNKIALLSAREQLQENLLTYLDGLPQSTLDNVCLLVCDAFNVLDSAVKQPRQAVYVVQVGTVGYRVEKTTNFLDVRCPSMLTQHEIESLIARGIHVTISRNK